MNWCSLLPVTTAVLSVMRSVMQAISAKIRGSLLELCKNQPWPFPKEPVKVSGGSKAQRALVEGIRPGINKKPNQGIQISTDQLE